MEVGFFPGFAACILITISLFPVRAYGIYNDTMCCLVAQQQSQFLPPVPENPVCGQSYNPTHPPAPDLVVTYDFCQRNCRGIGLSQAKQPGQWAAPLVQFILPSVIFAMSIPRRKHVDFDFVTVAKHFEQSHSAWPTNMLIVALTRLWATILLLVDTTIWVIIIIIQAGCLMVAGLHEALLDHCVLSLIEERAQFPAHSEEVTELLVTVVCGNLDLQRGDPRSEILRELNKLGNGSKTDRLLAMMSAQSSFGAMIGAPVVFYLGAFVYTILDLRNNPSDQDSAISLAFGVEWMIIPHVAIVSGILLASNNPSTASVLTGTPGEPATKAVTWLHMLHWLTGWRDTYETTFQPVSMWSRGDNKMKWLKASRMYPSSTRYRQHFHIQWWKWITFILLPAITLISLPATAGAVVAYKTPPIGWGCRSLSFIVYAGTQVVLTVLAVVTSAFRQTETTVHYRKEWEWVTKCFVLPPLLFLSLVAAVGGTLMQIIGVFRNCVCYVNAQHWIDIYNGQVNVASDTHDQRNASTNWIVMGSFATAFMGFCCFLGWWYMRSVRQRFQRQVERL